MLFAHTGRDNMTIMAQNIGKCGNSKDMQRKQPEKETIHSGHFMVSDFEAEAQDDGDELAVPLPEEVEQKAVIPRTGTVAQTGTKDGSNFFKFAGQHLSIETSLTKLFQCMSLAYRQKLTSPKWNRFKGIRLRWKDKIRLNNVIWRCWHMQFIGKKNALVCQFASPLDVDTHNKPEAVVLEGKYWKRKLSAVTAEYKKWRMYYRNQILGCHPKDGFDMLSDLESIDWQIPKPNTMVADEDYMEFMSDTLFSTISLNQPFAFPDTREIARGAGLADFIQPSLVQLQPNLDDFMDTLEPLQDLFQAKLAPVPEESGSNSQEIFKGSPQYDVNIQSAEKSLSSQMTYNYMNNWYLPPYTPPSTPDLTSSSQFKMPSTSFPSQPLQNSKPSVQSITNTPLVDKQSTSRREDVFIVPKIKSKTRSQSGPSVLQRKEPMSSQNIVSAVSDPVLQTSGQQNNSVLLEQLLTNKVNVVFGCIGNDQAGAVSTSVTNNASFAPNMYRPIEPALMYHQSDIGKSQGQYTISSDAKKNSPLIPSSPVASPPMGSALLISPTPSPLPNLSYVSTNTTSPDSPVSDPLSYSPQSMASPSSSCTSPSSVKIVPGYKEHRRVCHINAEQKRRCNIKNGFDTLHALIPQLSQNPNSKLSKAAMLQKGADYIRQLRNERNHLKQEIDSLRQQIDSLNASISNCQAMLPAAGAPVSKQRSTKMRDMFQQYVRQRTHEDWKFWILSLICEPLLVSFSANVSTASLEELYTSTLQWVDQHCSLVDLRPIVLNSLRQLCTSTEVLSDPSRLPMEAKAAVDGRLTKK